MRKKYCSLSILVVIAEKPGFSKKPGFWPGRLHKLFRIAIFISTWYCSGKIYGAAQSLDKPAPFWIGSAYSLLVMAGGLLSLLGAPSPVPSAGILLGAGEAFLALLEIMKAGLQWQGRISLTGISDEFPAQVTLARAAAAVRDIILQCRSVGAPADARSVTIAVAAAASPRPRALSHRNRQLRSLSVCTV